MLGQLCVSLVRYVWDLPTRLLSMCQGSCMWLVLPQTVDLRVQVSSVPNKTLAALPNSRFRIT